MSTDPMRPLPSPPPDDESREERAPDTGGDTRPVRDTAPPAASTPGGLPFRPARRNTPTMVSAQRSERRVETVNMMSPALESALPFKRARIPTPPATSTSAPPHPFKVSAEMGAVRAPAANAMVALPFRSADARGRLTLEQYASLAAEIAVWPAAVPQLRARYGLDETAHRDEQAIWQHRFSNDRELFARYAALFQHYRGWLERRIP